MTSGTVSSLFVLLFSCTNVLAQSAETQQVQFNQVLNINGDMAINSFQFPDRSRIETFSQKQQQIIVNQQNPAIPANQVTGTTGQPFVQISPQSMTIGTNGATDLVGGQVQMAINQQVLQQQAVQPDNTYVAMLSPDRQTWMIQETLRMVNGTDMTVRMVKRNQLDGEYMVVGRQTVETNTLVQPFGSSVGIQGTGLQENEYQDGFRMSTRAQQPVTMKLDVKDGIDSSMLAALQGSESVNDYRYSVVTNLGAVTPELNQQVTVVQMPINAVRIQKMMQAMGIPPTGQVALGIAQRGVLQNPGGATGNLGGAAAGGTARRGLGRLLFRKNVVRQVQGGRQSQQQAQGDQQAQEAQQGQGAQQAQAGQAQASEQQQQQQQRQQQQAGQQVQGGQQIQNGQQIQGGQQNQQAGTPTNNNPVATALLLAPTFTPVQANAVLDQANLRIAVPVRQIDGEYILVMQKMEGAATPAQPARGEGQQQAAPVESKAPTIIGEGQERANGTGSAKPAETSKAAEAGKPAAEGEKATKEGEQKKERRQAAAETDKYGLPKPPQGSVIMSMKMIDEMVASVQWGGQAAITQIMNEYVKAQTGQALFETDNSTAPGIAQLSA